MRTGLLANRYDSEAAGPADRGNSPSRGTSPGRLSPFNPATRGVSPGRLSPQRPAAAGHHAMQYQPQAQYQPAGGAFVPPTRRASPPASPRGRALQPQFQQYQQYPGSRN